MPKKKVQPRRHILVFFSDTHGGSKFGFLAPGIRTIEEIIDKDGMPRLEDVEILLNPIQQQLLSIIDDQLLELKKWIDEYKGTTVIMFHNGDATQGNKHKTFLMTITEDGQIDIGVGNIKYLADAIGAEEIHITLGTESHVFEEGSSEKRIFKTLRDHYKGRFVGLYNHVVVTVQGILVDVAHHGPAPGSRKWLEGNQLRWYLTNLFLSLLDKAPDIVVRSHVHVPQFQYYVGWLHGKSKRLLGIITP